MLGLGNLGRKVFGSAGDRRVKRYAPLVDRINALEAEHEALSDDDLRARTGQLRAELAAGKSLDDLLAPAFATVREAAKRTLGQRHFDVQLVGGMVLNEGSIAEMKTGEGKTLVATLAVYLNAFSKEKGWDVSSISLATMWFFFVGGIVGVWAARLIVRYDIRIVVSAGAVVVRFLVAVFLGVRLLAMAPPRPGTLSETLPRASSCEPPSDLRRRQTPVARVARAAWPRPG